MNFSLKNKNALVTGGSRGIGRAIAIDLSAAGARVLVHCNRNLSAARETLGLLHGDGHRTLRADLSREGGIRDLFLQAEEMVPGIDILVNNAGVYQEKSVTEMDYEQWLDKWRHTLAINLNAPAHLCFLAARHMTGRGGGKIINISSRGAFRGEPEAPDYAASKAGLNALSQSLAKALAPHGIYLYVVAPGFVETDMTADYLTGPKGEEIRRQSPLNRVAAPEEVARTVLFLAGEGSEYLTGAIIDINGASYLRT